MTTQAAATDPNQANAGANTGSQKNDDFVPKKDYDSLVSEKERLTQYGTGLADQLKAASDEKAALEARLKELTEAGKNTPGKKNKAENNSNDDLEAFEQKIRGEFAPIIEEKDTKITKLEAQIKEFTLVSTVMAKFGTHLNEDMMPVVTNMVRQVADFDRGNPKLVIFKDENGKVLHSPKNPSIPMNEEEYLELMKTKMPSAFKASAVTTGSMPNGTINSSSNTGTGHDQYSGLTKQQYIQNRENYDRSTRVQLDKRFGL
jgi:hypothetical protein